MKELNAQEVALVSGGENIDLEKAFVRSFSVVALPVVLTYTFVALSLRNGPVEAYQILDSLLS